MSDFFADWRLRFAVHAALLMALTGVLGFRYRWALQHDDGPACNYAQAAPACDPKQKFEQAPCADHPCLPDTVLEHRWRMAHQQGVNHALLLLGFAVAAPYFRVGRFVFRAVGWLVIIGCWAAPVSAILSAWSTYRDSPEIFCWVLCTQTPGLDLVLGVLERLPGFDLLAASVRWLIGVEIAPSSCTTRALDCLANTIGAVAGITTLIALGIVALRSAWEVLRDGVAPNTWNNWAQIVKARPRRIAAPRNLGELLAVVETAVRQRMGVRAFGGRYSWSAIAPSDGVMIDMRQFRSIDPPQPIQPGDPNLDPASTHTVTVDAGVQIGALREFLADQGLMLKTSTVTPRVEIGGAIALGCHGTGSLHRPLSDYVTRIQIVQYDSARHATLASYDRPPVPPSPTDPDWVNWRALMLNLGCLGVIYRVTLECEPSFDVRLFDTRIPVSQLLDPARLRAIDQMQYAEIFWFPFNEECFVREWHRIPQAARRGFPFWYLARNWIVAKVLGPPFFWLLASLPFLTRIATRSFHRFFGNLDFELSAPEAMQYERYFMRVYDMGYAIPYDPDPSNPIGFEQFQKAWRFVQNHLDALHHQAVYPQNLVLHVRLGAESAAYLAPNVEMPRCAYFEIVTHANTGRHREHFEAVERYWRRLGGRTHWGKLTYDHTRIHETYPGASLANFLGVRRRMDPEQVFLNDYLREALDEVTP